MNKYEIFEKNAKGVMTKFDLFEFRKSHTKLYITILFSMQEYSDLQNQELKTKVRELEELINNKN
jgi:hypothetical protein